MQLTTSLAVRACRSMQGERCCASRSPAVGRVLALIQGGSEPLTLLSTRVLRSPLSRSTGGGTMSLHSFIGRLATYQVVVELALSTLGGGALADCSSGGCILSGAI